MGAKYFNKVMALEEKHIMITPVSLENFNYLVILLWDFRLEKLGELNIYNKLIKNISNSNLLMGICQLHVYMTFIYAFPVNEDKLIMVLGLMKFFALVY